MARWARRILVLLGGGLLAATLALWAWTAREYRRDPMPLIDLPAGPLVVRSAVARPWTSSSGEPRRLVELIFDGAPEGPVRAALSLPREDAGPLPVVLVLGGLEVGSDSLRYVEVHGANALLAFEYPRPSHDLYEAPLLPKLPRIRRAALAVPAQAAALLRWSAGQPWADPGRQSLLGYSFGAMFIPAAARVAEARGLKLRCLVMAYGGADLPALFAANTRLRPAWLRGPLARMLGAVLRPLEPSLHLPELHTEALFVTGLRDRRVPLACARLMQALKPPPKTVLDLDAGHMDPADPALNRRIVGASRDWLIARGAISP